MWWNKAKRAVPVKAPVKPALAMALEPRMLFDGAVAATMAEAADAKPTADTAAKDAQAHPAQDNSAHDASKDNLSAVPAGTSDHRQEVVFVDASVKGYQQLVAGLKPGTEVVVLDANKDGLQQIADYLQGRSGIDSIHILSHGDVGKVQLGNIWLDGSSIALRSDLLTSIGQALDKNGDILLYGCQVGADGAGHSFVDQLADATGADVAASNDMTGATALGGNWVLEVSHGAVEAAALDVGDFRGLLVSFNDDFSTDTGQTASFTRVLGGVSYTYTFTSAGDGGDAAWENLYGEGNSASINLLSASPNTGTTEVFTIARTDGADFTFTSIYLNNGAGETVTVAGYRDGVLVGTAQTVLMGQQRTLSFGGIRVDEVRISGSDFFNTNIDSFAGDPVPPSTAPTVTATASNPSFTENGAAVDLFSGVVAASNDAGETFTGMTLRVTNVSNGASEFLNIGGVDIALSNGSSGTIAGIGSYSVSLSGGTALITLSSLSRDNTQMAQLIDGITYRNSSDNPGSATRAVTVVTVTDSGPNNNSATPNLTSSVAVSPVNDAPTLNPANNSVSYTEGGSSAVLVGSLVLADADSTTFQGATVIISDFRSGDVLSVSVSGGFSATYNGTTGVMQISGSGSLASLQAVLRSVSYSSSSDDPTFGGTDITRQVNFTVTDAEGGTSNLATAQLTVTAVNDAPTLSGGPYAWAGTSEDATSSAVSVSSLLSGVSYADGDGPNSGIAIIASTGSGDWQYSTDGVTWTQVGSVSGTSALMLSATTQLRYVPNGQNGETAALSFRAWDGTVGIASTNGVRSTSDTSTNGGSTAFSSGTAQAMLIVSSENDAPVLTPTAPTLTGLTDSDIDNVGQAVSSFLGSVSDVDNGALTGIAITGLNAGNGTWQYSVNGGASWQNVGVVSLNSALLLRSIDRVRFVPDGINGTSASITYRAWDQTDITAGLQGTKANATGAGGGSPYSIGSDTASITVTAINDAPLITASGGSAAFVEGADVASTPVVIDSGLTVTDADSPLLQGARVQIAGNFQMGEDALGFTSNPATMGDIVGVYDSATGTMILSSAAGATAAQWQAALRSVTYSNSSDTPNTSTRSISFSVSDGSLDSASATRTVTVTAANDSPQLSLPTVINLIEDSSGSITGISVSDVDAGTGNVQVTFTLPAGYGTLNAAVSGTVAVGTAMYSVILTGRVADINAYLAGNNLTYMPSPNYFGDVSLDVRVSDLGNSGGPAQTSSGSLTLHVEGVNDVPNLPVVPSSPVNANEDVPLVLTGISFSDIDAGSGQVEASFSVLPDKGTFSALAAGGVTLTGSGSNHLVLSGTLADINAFIASGAVSYLSAANASGTVTVTVRLDDLGNTGMGGNLYASSTFNLAISPVNDAPVNSVPGSQSVLGGQTLFFGVGSGNPISISDVDVGTGTMRVTLTAVNGTITLGSVTGLAFSVGSGSADSTVTFDGSLADINHALAGMSFSPTAGYNGPASLQIVSNDLGQSGSGGSQTDSDFILITVEQPNPRIVSVSAGNPDGTYKVGDLIVVQVQFDRSVFVNTSGGVPSLLLETGLVDREAVYISGSGSNILTFQYIVQAGDRSADLDAQSTTALRLNGAVLANANNDLAILTLPTIGGADSLGGRSDIVIDGVAPTVTSVGVPANGTYVAGQNLDFTVNFNENVIVDSSGGTPRIAVTLDSGGTVFAQYVSGSGGSALVFRLVVATGQLDTNGISLGSSIQANGGVLRDAAGNNIITGLNGVASTSGVLVDAVVPTVSSVSVPVGVPYNAGDTLTFVVNTSEAVVVNGAPRLALDIGGHTVFADLVAGSGTSTLVFQYTVQAGDNDADGISVGALSANGATLRDVAGNDMNLTLNNVGGTNGVIVDTVAPTPSAIVTLDPSPTNAGSVRYTVTFSENVSGVDLGDFTLVGSGTAAGSLSGLQQIDARTYQITVSGISGTGTLGLNLNGSATGIVDAAGNPLSGGLAGAVYSVDRDAPTITAVSVPPGALHKAGDTLEFVVQTSEAVLVDGSPKLAIDMGGRTVFADYVSGSGSNSLVFRYTVQAGDNDADGIQVSGLSANGGSLRDATGNALNPSLNGVGDSHGVLVDTRAPTATGVVRLDPSPTGASTVNFLVTFDEDVNGVDAGDFSLVTSNSASGSIVSVVQLDARIYRVTVGSVSGQGSLGLTVNAGGINDAAGNALGNSLRGDSYVIGSLSDGDPQFRITTPSVPTTPSTTPLQPNVPVLVTPQGTSPVLPSSLFQSEGPGGLPPLGNIFVQDGGLSQSFIAQAFGSSSFGDGSGSGFLGFGGGDAGVFGSSTLAGIFDRNGVDENTPLKAFDRRSGHIDQGIRGIFGAPSLTQQLQQIHDSEQQPVRELAWALGQVAQGRDAS
ncbi:DUF4347 domain-containing protein [Pseudomonas sp. GD04087]|uniref:DUF4347 domain-containing protein n=1 Tax=unclassified Pseudomonas TaxID=196821 RepID=UPI00244968B4|nr:MULTISPECIES: DUF4347 domain-containing protein [unclassified Pseudomonas]MDH0292045.1 DUF4347 domain-containing protein [Pseudomonas sp. GD04087]MDH1052613.1 DUF4347 domain-containing protein [Pseudomonas sp. GD03903]MDH2001470.1 DUF4347 domain-containing protein [Pseudomonas sp. GD03691]